MLRKSILVTLLLFLLLLVGGCSQNDQPSVVAEKNIVVEVVHKDGSCKEFEFQTDKNTLGEVLREEELIQEESGSYGFFITTVDGELADEKEEEWWRISQEGEAIMSGVDDILLTDDSKFELVLTVGYDKL